MSRYFDVHRRDWDKAIESKKKELKKNKVHSNTLNVILNFIEECRYTSCSKTIYKKFLFLCQLVENLKKLTGKDDINKLTIDEEKKVARWIQDNKNWGDDSTKERLLWLRMIIKFYRNKEFVQDNYKWLNDMRNRIREHSRVRDEEVLKPIQIEEMIRKADSVRDKAMISFMYESAARPEELLTLKIKSIEFDNYCAKIRLWEKTKTPRIPMRLPNTTTYLRNWLNIHPYSDNPEAPLWLRKNVVSQKNKRPEPMTVVALNGLIKRIAKKAGIRHNVCSYSIRHARITEWRKDPRYTDDEVKKLSGHSLASRHFTNYTHITPTDIENKQLQNAGFIRRTNYNGDIQTASKKCWNCKESNDESAKFCSRCHVPLDVNNPSALNEMADEDEDPIILARRLERLLIKMNDKGLIDLEKITNRNND